MTSTTSILWMMGLIRRQRRKKRRRRGGIPEQWPVAGFSILHTIFSLLFSLLDEAHSGRISLPNPAFPFHPCLASPRPLVPIGKAQTSQ